MSAVEDMDKRGLLVKATEQGAVANRSSFAPHFTPCFAAFFAFYFAAYFWRR